MTKLSDLRALFWRAEPTGATSPPAPDHDAAATTAARPSKPSPASAAAPRPAARAVTTAVAPAADRPGGAQPELATGDPRVDQTVVAFEAMEPAMPAAQLAIALAATVRALGLEPGHVVDVLARRLAATSEARGQRARALAERGTARTAELDAVTAKVEAEIQAMEQRIGGLRKQLAGAGERLAELEARDRAEADAADARDAADTRRLAALHQFLSDRRGA